MTILVDVHREKQSVDSVDRLEKGDALRPNGKLAGIPLRRVSLKHL
jgi:hypothetical protein